jgi:type II secretory pathway pseudopilin PulG
MNGPVARIRRTHAYLEMLAIAITSSRRLRGESGWTLMELLVAAGLLLLILGAALPVIVASVQTEPKISQKADRIQQARILVERMGRDLRATYLVVPPATANSLVFETYLRRTTCGGSFQPSEGAPPIKCRVVYSCSAGTCTRQEQNQGGGGGGTAVKMVGGLSDSNVFTYYPSATNPTFVEVKAVMPGSSAGEDAVTLEDGFALRNLSPPGP